MLFTPSNKRSANIAHDDRLKREPRIQHGAPPFVPLVLRRRVFDDPPSVLKRVGIDAAHQPKLMSRPCRLSNPDVDMRIGGVAHVRGSVRGILT